MEPKQVFLDHAPMPSLCAEQPEPTQYSGGVTAFAGDDDSRVTPLATQGGRVELRRGGEEMGVVTPDPDNTWHHRGAGRRVLLFTTVISKKSLLPRTVFLAYKGINSFLKKEIYCT